MSSSIGIWFYDPQTGKELELLAYADGVPPFAFAYSPDGNTIASASTNEMIVITGRIESRLPSISGNIVQMRDIATGEKRTRVSTQTQKVASIVYAPDGKTIATARTRDNTVYLWDATTGKANGTLERVGSGSIQAFVYAPDGKTIATAGGWTDNVVQLWDAQTGAHKTTLTRHRKRVNSIAYAPDGNAIVSGSTDGTVRLWDADTGEPKAVLTGYTHINAVAYAPDGKTIATGGRYQKNSLQLWDAETKKRKTTFTEHTDGTLASIVYSPDGDTIAAVNSRDNTVRLWHAKTGKHKFTFKQVNELSVRGTARAYDISSVAYAPDAQTIAIVGGHYKEHKGTVSLWHVQTRKRKIIYEGPDYISSVAYSRTAEPLLPEAGTVKYRSGIL